MPLIEWQALWQATFETIYIVFISSALSILIGLGVGLLLFLTRPAQPLARQILHQSLSLLVNITRSIPFIILMISILPFTRLLIGTTIGINAAVVPLTLAAIPFFARIAENAFAEISMSLLEPARAFGATTRELVSKVLIPESLPALIRGATLTVIALISYSAMAGVVGGGGLGELAINYGYQRFNVMVMLETVIILVLLVALLQWWGEKLAKTCRLKSAAFVAVLLSFACIGYVIWPAFHASQNIVRVGIMSGWPEEVMKVAKEVAKEQYHLDLQIVAFNDYVLPNTALASGNIDANIFQHEPYLKAQIAARGFKLVAIGKTFVYPMGFYSKKISQLPLLRQGAIVALPNDPSNEARALLLLKRAQLISLREEASGAFSVRDILANPKHLQFITLDAAQLPRALQDADLVALTNDYVSTAHLTIADALLKEDAHSPYANVIVVQAADQHNASLLTLVQVMHSKAVVNATEKLFPNGAAIPAW